MNRVYVAQPNLSGNAREYVLECLDSGWVSSNGRFIGEFEERFAEFCGTRYAVATNNGTTALHLALAALGLGPGDEVIIPTVTYIATANAVRYCGAKPVLVDVEPGTLNIDPWRIEEAITDRTRGIVPVHLYGHPADMSLIGKIAERHGLWVVEDAAEAHGASVASAMAGSMGNCGVFSFYGNKIITTGEGGMVTTNDASLAARLRLLRGQGMSPERRYWFEVVGFNYRMTNIAAALGLSQLERIDQALQHRRTLSEWYTRALGELVGEQYLELPSERLGYKHAYWMYTVFLHGADATRRDKIMTILDSMGIETRPVFHPMHVMPPYADDRGYPVADAWAIRGINLPTHEGVGQREVTRIAEALSAAIRVRA